MNGQLSSPVRSVSSWGTYLIPPIIRRRLTIDRRAMVHLCRTRYLIAYLTIDSSEKGVIIEEPSTRWDKAYWYVIAPRATVELDTDDTGYRAGLHILSRRRVCRLYSHVHWLDSSTGKQKTTGHCWQYSTIQNVYASLHRSLVSIYAIASMTSTSSRSIIRYRKDDLTLSGLDSWSTRRTTFGTPHSET